MATPLFRPLARALTRLLWLFGLLLGALPVQAAEAGLVRLSASQPVVDPWPGVRLWVDRSAALDWSSALARLPEFTVPQGPAGNLGNQRDPVWLALTVRAEAGDSDREGDRDGALDGALDGHGDRAPGRDSQPWVFDIDYPAFNEARLYLVADGRLVSETVLGSALPFEARPMRTRTHAATLNLVPGQTYQLLLRLRTDSAMVLPITLSRPDSYHEREARRLVSQGLMFGLAAALLAYCIVNGLSLRNTLFALYAALLIGSAAFFIDYTGLGQQFLWSERSGMTAMISPLSVFLAMAAGGSFVMRALDTRRHSPLLHRGLVVLSGLSGVLLLLGLAGALTYRQAQGLATVIGPVVPALVIPAAWRRARSGDRVGLYMLIGWSCYVVGALCAASLLRGLVPANFWTLHLFQWASLLEMLAWLRVLGLHIEAVRRDAQRHAAAARNLEVVAQTDALTGLPNRRGLDAALGAALERAHDEHLLALFLIDLDGFKAVNDRLGHAAGDQLLIEVGHRLGAELRRSDLVARLGGDEFVVLAEGLQDEAQARRIGQKLLAAFSEPVRVDGEPCRIGLTIGYALAPQDGLQAADLMRLADAAMYAGKRAGRHCMHRAGGAAAAIA